MANEITKELIDAVEKIYGEDVGDYLHLIQEMKDEPDFFALVLYDKRKLMIYWGAEDVNNCEIIFSAEVRNVRCFSSEGNFEIRDLYFLISGIDFRDHN